MDILFYISECLWIITFLFGIAYKWLLNTNPINQAKFIWIEHIFFGSSIASLICTIVFLFIYLS